ncbi:MAG: glycosyltransferase family 39 protein [Lachnospiraceae bacterium]|nr:glycosyltransferase family 39 protein [Lachnospiraceae bacterium]
MNMAQWNPYLLWAAILLCAAALIRDIVTTMKARSKPGNKSSNKSGSKVRNKGFLSGMEPKEMSDKTYYIILGVLLFIALLVRAYKFGIVPAGFNQDGAMAAVDAKALADYGTDRYGMYRPVHLTAWGYGQMSSLLSYMMAFFIDLFGFGPGIARFPMLLMSMVGIVSLHFFIKDIFGKNLSLAVLLFAAVNPWHIMQSRWALDCNLYPHFFMLGVYLLNRGIQGTKKRYLYMSMVSFGLCMYCYGVSIYTLPVFLVAACTYLLISKKLNWKEALISAGVYLLVAWPFILTMMVNFFQWETINTPFFTIAYFPYSQRSSDILFFSGNIGEQLKANFQSLLNTTLLQRKDLPWNDVYNFGTVYLFSMPFVVLGIVDFFKNHRKKTGAVLAFIFLCTGIWAGLTTNGVNVNRINIVYYPIIIMGGLGIGYCAKWIPRAKWGIIVAYALAFVMFTNTYFTKTADDLSGHFFGNFGEAVTYVKDAPEDKVYITADSQYTGASNVSEILTLFFHETDAEYYQGKKDISGWLPFWERYRFSSIGNLSIDHSEEAVYVVRDYDLSYFPADIYEVIPFETYPMAPKYYVVRKR